MAMGKGATYFTNVGLEGGVSTRNEIRSELLYNTCYAWKGILALYMDSFKVLELWGLFT